MCCAWHWTCALLGTSRTATTRPAAHKPLLCANGQYTNGLALLPIALISRAIIGAIPRFRPVPNHILDFPPRAICAMETVHQLGRYEIVAELGRGAMGAVFRARDPKIDRTVAIKTISVPAVAAKDIEHYRQRFFREAQAAGRMSHPGIVTIYDVGEDETTHTPFIVMECVEGDSLDRLVAATPAGKLPRDIALDLLRQIAEALDYAHLQGIVH